MKTRLQAHDHVPWAWQGPEQEVLQTMLDASWLSIAVVTIWPEGLLLLQPQAHVPWAWQGPEQDVLRAMLRMLHTFCVRKVATGWRSLDHAAHYIR